MPIYIFKCPTCNAEQEYLMKSSDQTPRCESDNTEMEKQFTTPAFRFTNGIGTDGGNLMSIPGQNRTQI